MRRLLLALRRRRLGLCSTHRLHPSTYSMTTYQFFTTAWTWNSVVLALSAVASFGYVLAFGRRGRPAYFAAALAIFLLSFISPVNALSNRYLFSAHMVQHILFVLIVPALLLLSLPPSFSVRSPLTHPLIGWIAGGR